MGVHDGHRARMKARFVRNGLDNFDDHSVLELLLFYAVPRRDVNELAHALLDHFGTLDAVFEASYEDMMRVPGVGENVATLLTLIPQVGRRYQMAKRRQQTILRSREDELTTRRIRDALLLVGITLADHIIVCGEDYVSFADSGLL